MDVTLQAAPASKLMFIHTQRSARWSGHSASSGRPRHSLWMYSSFGRL